MVEGILESDPEREAHLLELGRAIAEWAHVEEQLYNIVHALLGCTMQRAAIVYYRSHTLESRLQLADALLKTAFPQPSANPGSHHHPGYVTWTEIQGDMRDALHFRNRLAHDPVDLRANVWKNEDSGEFVIGPQKIVTASSIAKALNKGLSEPAIEVEEIKSHAAQVSVFRERLLSFRSGPLGVRLQELAAQSGSRSPTQDPNPQPQEPQPPE